MRDLYDCAYGAAKGKYNVKVPVSSRLNSPLALYQEARYVLERFASRPKILNAAIGIFQ